MLDEFLIAQRETIISRARTRVSKRISPRPTQAELVNGIPIFLDQLGDALRLAQTSDAVDHAEIGKSAGKHGLDLLEQGLTIAQVVHDYGDVCQAVTELALELNVPLSGKEFKVLNLCLDDAIAEAVTQFSRRREEVAAKEGTERLGTLAHELRNVLSTAMLSFDSIKLGRVPVAGSTSAILGRSLVGLRDLIDRSLADVRMDAGLVRMEPVVVADFVEEVEVGASMMARSRDLELTVTSVDRSVVIDADRQILAGAVSNLLHNAVKFTRNRGGKIALRAIATDDRVTFEVEDECGGLPPGDASVLFKAFEQRGNDLSGLGLGLAICRKAAKTNGGEISVRDIPGKGCVFILDLPRKRAPVEGNGG